MQHDEQLLPAIVRTSTQYFEVCGTLLEVGQAEGLPEFCACRSLEATELELARLLKHTNSGNGGWNWESTSGHHLESRWPVIMGYFGSFMGYFME